MIVINYDGSEAAKKELTAALESHEIERVDRLTTKHEEKEWSDGDLYIHRKIESDLLVYILKYKGR